MMNLSIIIPVYNVEDYVGKCLESVLNQRTELDYEVIVVNDGTPDSSMDVVEKVISKYPNRKVRIINQENQGLSMARNNGIDAAEGEWVLWIDSDDWISDDALSILESHILDNKLQAIGYASAYVKDGVQILENDRSRWDGQVLRGAELIDDKYFVIGSYTLYRKSFLDEHGLRYMPGVLHEDTEFTPRVYYYLDRLLIINNILYLRHDNPESITNTFNPKRVFDSMIIADALYDFYEKEVSSEYTRAFARRVGGAVNAVLLLSDRLSAEDSARLSVMLGQRRHLYRFMMKSSSMKYRLEGLIFSLFPSRVLSLFAAMNKLYCK